MSTIDDPVERFVSVVKFYLSGWHIKPPYVYTLWLYGYIVGNMCSNALQRCQETAESNSGRDVHGLLGVLGWHARVLHF